MNAVCALLLSLLMGIGGSTDPYAIYDRARHVWGSEVYPAVIQYRTTVRVAEGDKIEEQHYREQADGSDIRPEGVSAEEQHDPHQTSGVNFKVSFEIRLNAHAGGETSSISEDAHRREDPADYLGMPVISPMYSFGIDPAQAAPAPKQTPFTLATSSPELPTIADVATSQRDYNISLIGQEALGGLLAYHLRLRPIRDPRKYRLRDMWVDAYTYHVLKLVLQGDFTGSPMTDVPWVITFEDFDGATYIKTETAEAPLIFKHDRIFTAASITFDEITEGASTTPVLPYLGSSDDLREP